MNNELDVFELGEVNPPTYAGEKIEVDGSLALVKPGKKIKTTNTDMDIQPTFIVAIEINEIRFEADERFPWITVYRLDEDNLTRIDEIDCDSAIVIHSLKQLKVIALNWYFNNVEVVKEIDADEEEEESING